MVVGHTKEEVRLMGAIFENDAGAKMTVAQGQAILHGMLGPKAAQVEQEYALDTAPEPNGATTQALTDFLMATGEQNDRDRWQNMCPCTRTEATTRTRPKATCMRFIPRSVPATTSTWPTCSSGTTSRKEARVHAGAARWRCKWGATSASSRRPAIRMGRPAALVADERRPGAVSGAASTGGVRGMPVDTYLAEHKIAFWRSLMSPAPSKGN